MAWTDSCKFEAVAQIDKRKETAGGIRPAIRELSEESGIPAGTLREWYYPPKCPKTRTPKPKAQRNYDLLIAMAGAYLESPAITIEGLHELIGILTDTANEAAEQTLYAEAELGKVLIEIREWLTENCPSLLELFEKNKFEELSQVLNSVITQIEANLAEAELKLMQLEGGCNEPNSYRSAKKQQRDNPV